MAQRSKRTQSRRRFLKGALLAGGGLHAAEVEPTWLGIVHRPMDAITGGQVAHLDRAAELVASLRSIDGVVAVLGSHDYCLHSPGTRAGSVGQRTATALRDAGATVLCNESVTIQRRTGRIYLVGLDDYRSGRFDPNRALARVARSFPCLALAHNADAFLDLLETPAQWLLSGHTHGGQMCVPWLGALILTIRNRRFAVGHVAMCSGNLCINRGLGWLRRVRPNCRPEITLFRLAQA